MNKLNERLTLIANLSVVVGRALGMGMGSAVAVHYALSYERIQWLLSQ